MALTALQIVGLLVIVVGIVLTIVFLNLTKKCEDKKPPVELQREEENKIQKEKNQKCMRNEHCKDFFKSGLGFLKNMDTDGMEEAYMQYMREGTGAGNLYLSDAQVKTEVARLVEDRDIFEKHVQGKERPSFNRKQGFIQMAVNEDKVKSVKK